MIELDPPGERGNSLVPTSIFEQIQLLEPLGYKAVRFLQQPFDDHQYTIKTDFHPKSNHAFSVRFAGQNNSGLNDQAGYLIVFTDESGGNTTKNDLYNLLGSWTWTASSNVVNQFTYQFSDFNNQIGVTTDLPNLIFSDGLSVGRNGNVPQQTLQRKHQFHDDLTWNRGAHGFKFGVDYTHESAKLFSWYLQDDWKITPRFTLNLGVRYDLDIGYVDSNFQEGNRAVQFLKIIGHPAGQRVAKDDKNNFAPRIGFAWDFRGNSRSVIRGGYGIYFDQSFLNVPLFAVQLANPEIYALIIDDSPNLSFASPAPPFPRPLTNPPIGFPVNGRLIDPDYESPYTQQWNIGFAQELGQNMALDFDYVHILGLHEFTQLDINPRIGPLINAQRTDQNPPHGY